MAETGCLNNEKYSNLEVTQKFKTKNIHADKLKFNNEMIESNQDGEGLNVDSFSSYSEGKIIDIHTKSNTFLGQDISGDDNNTDSKLTMEISWPKKTLLKTVSIMFIEPDDTTENYLELANTNNIEISLGVKKDDDIDVDGIMSNKKLLGGDTDFVGNEDIATIIKVSKNVPITIIRNSTGMLQGDIRQSPALVRESDANNKSDRSQGFNIQNIADSWTANTNFGPASPFFPLYNPVNGVDKLLLSFEHKQDGGNSTLFTNTAAVYQRFKVMMICTFLRMDEF